jgi:hypothetical protein
LQPHAAAREQKEPGVEAGAYLVADAEPFEPVEPGEGPLDAPTGPARAGSARGPAASDLRCDSPGPEQAAVLVEVLATSSRTFPGSCAARGRRHRTSAAESASAVTGGLTLAGRSSSCRPAPAGRTAPRHLPGAEAPRCRRHQACPSRGDRGVGAGDNHRNGSHSIGGPQPPLPVGLLGCHRALDRFTHRVDVQGSWKPDRRG